MRGFWALAGVYAALWAAVLLPGLYALLRRTGTVPLPDDDPSPARWIARVRRELVRRAGEAPVPPQAVPTHLPEGRRRLKPSEEAVRVRGTLLVPEDTVVTVGLIVSGDLRLGPRSRLLAPVWVSGRVLLGEGSSAALVVAERALRLRPEARIEGNAASRGVISLEDGARIEGTAVARKGIQLAPNTLVGAGIAPVVRGGTVPEDVEAEPVPAFRGIRAPEWTPDMDEALRELWPGGRLSELVDGFADRTGHLVRGVHLLRRARDLRLYPLGIPRRPGFLGRRPAWVLTPEIVRVGADLRIPPGEHVGYSLVVEGALEVLREAEMEAPVRTGRGLLLHPGAVVHGAAVSDGLVVCEEGAAIWGPVDSSMHVLLFANSRMGRRGAGGVNARGAIGIEPGAEILGGAVAGLGVRGEGMRPEPLRAERAGEDEAEGDNGEQAPRRLGKRRRRRRARMAAERASETEPAEAEPAAP